MRLIFLLNFFTINCSIVWIWFSFHAEKLCLFLINVISNINYKHVSHIIKLLIKRIADLFDLFNVGQIVAFDFVKLWLCQLILHFSYFSFVLFCSYYDLVMESECLLFSPYYLFSILFVILLNFINKFVLRIFLNWEEIMHNK